MSKTKDKLIEQGQISVQDLIDSFPNYEAIERMGAERQGDYSLT